MTGPLFEKNGVLHLAVHVTPKASVNRITGVFKRARGVMSLAVKVTAAPDKGRANKAVMKLLAHDLHMPKTTITLIRGGTDRNKIFELRGDAGAVSARIAHCLTSLNEEALHGKNH